MYTEPLHYQWEEANIYLFKRCFMIERQIARHFVHYSECLSNPLPFYATQILNPFLNLIILAKHDKGLGYI